MKVIVTTLLFLAFMLQLNAQDSRNVKFYIAPGHVSFLKIDKQKLYQLDTMQYPYRIELSAGEHYIEVWAPKYNLYTETITIIADSINKVIIDVEDETAAYRTYSKNLSERRFKQIGRMLPLALVIANDVRWTVKKMNELEVLESDANRTYVRVVEAKDKYESTISASAYNTYRAEYNKLNDQYKAEQKEYNSLRNKTILVNAGTGLLLGGAIVVFQKFKLEKPVKPIFENPLLSSTSISISPNTIGLTLNF